ncbi:hypothetical protein lbkm_3489 [Lachnospiraceae bacterium KM106-2]|nr:hypothetical protein lbkm_3489 [Lachnospiraceae bacterium KM106-2]
MSFGSNLERIRKDKKISQAKLGIALGLTQQMISSYEKDLSSPNIEVLTKIADYFNVSIDFLVGHVIRKNESNTNEARFLKYFENLSEIDRERCITIAETIFNDRSLSRE